MPEWALPVLALFLGSSVLVALITAPLAHRVGMRTARAQEVTAQAATTTAEVAGQKAAADVMEATTHRFEAMFRTAEALAVAASARAEKAAADLAALHLNHQQDMAVVNDRLADTKVALEECHALNQAVVERIAAVRSETSERLANLERGQNGA